MRRVPILAAMIVSLVLAGCSATPAPVAPPPPAVVIKPTPRPTPAPPPPLAADWNDWPFTPGDWVYRRDAVGSIALFGPLGANAMLTLRCDRARSVLFLSVPGPAAGATLRTTTLTRALPLQPTGGDAGYVAVQFAPGDTLLDAIVFSRGRFVVERAGQPPLVVPPYAEIGRVIEDCR